MNVSCGISLLSCSVWKYLGDTAHAQSEGSAGKTQSRFWFSVRPFAKVCVNGRHGHLAKRIFP